MTLSNLIRVVVCPTSANKTEMVVVPVTPPESVANTLNVYVSPRLKELTSLMYKIPLTSSYYMQKYKQEMFWFKRA